MKTASQGRLWPLQARPNTALPQPPTFDVPDGYWTKDDVHYPTPFIWRIGLLASHRTGGLGRDRRLRPSVQGMYQRSLGGEVYTRVVPPGGKDGPPPPRRVMAIATRVIPSMRRRDTAARRALETNLAGQLLEPWPTQRANFLAEISALRSVDLTDRG